MSNASFGQHSHRTTAFPHSSFVVKSRNPCYLNKCNKKSYYNSLVKSVVTAFMADEKWISAFQIIAADFINSYNDIFDNSALVYKFISFIILS